MTAVLYLLGLLLLAYLGSSLLGGGAGQRFGLPSSVEYVVLGFLLGPVLGLVDRDTMAVFDPLTQLAVGWLALVVGLDCGYVNGERVRGSSVVLSLGAGLVTGAVITTAVGLVLLVIAPDLGPAVRWTLAVAVAVACTETTPHAVQWVLGGEAQPSRIGKILSEVADVDAIAPVLATALVFALTPTSGDGEAARRTALGVGLGIGLGVATGLLTSALLGREFRLDESWRMLLGTALLTIGLAVQTHISPLAPMFLMGVTLSVTSRHRNEIVAMVTPTERAVLLPALLVAGVRLDLTSHPAVALIALGAVVARLLGRLLGGLAVRSVIGPASAPPWIGLGMASTGPLAMSIGLAFDLRFAGLVGDAVLASAAAVTLVGEFVGPPALRAALARPAEPREPPPTTTRSSGAHPAAASDTPEGGS